MIGNKADLEPQRSIPIETGRKAGVDLKLECFFEASALDGRGVQEAFDAFVKKMYKMSLEKKMRSTDVVSVRPTVVAPKKSSCTL